jgi:hypothetical protein
LRDSYTAIRVDSLRLPPSIPLISPPVFSAQDLRTTCLSGFLGIPDFVATISHVEGIKKHHQSG